MKIDKFLDWGVDWGLTDVLTDDLTDVKHNVLVLCDPHAREMLLSFPAAHVAYCSLIAATLCCCCSAAQVQLVVLHNHWVRLHCCT